MAVLGALAGSLLGPAAPVVQSVLGSVAGSLAQGVLQAAGGAVGGGQIASVTTGVQSLLGGLQEAFGRLFGQQRHQHLSTCPNRPPSFGTGMVPTDIMQNPLRFLTGMQGMFQNIGNLLQGLMKQFGLPGLQGPLQSGPFTGPFAPGLDQAFQGGTSGAPGASGGSSSIGGGDFTYLDRMQGEIERLMQSENPSDQIKAQMKMNQLSRIIDSITTLLAKQREIQSKIAQNLAR